MAAGVDLRPERRLLGLQGPQLPLREADVELIGQPAIQPRLREVERRPRRIDILAENHQFLLLRAHVEVSARDIGRDRHINPVACVL